MNPRTSLLVACLAALLAQTTAAQLTWVQRDFPMGSGHQMVYDAARGRVVLFGGSLSGPALADTWEWDGVSWRSRAQAWPWRAARVSHIWARARSRGTPRPSMYISPRLSWAIAAPNSAARRYHRAASARSTGRPSPKCRRVSPT